MKIITGLGNAGGAYENTFHNTGFAAADLLAEKLSVKFKSVKCRSHIAEGYLAGEKFVIAKPLTYMNLSGEAVRELLGYYKAALSDLAVIYDDIDLERGDLRVRPSGSGGTHNGMRNIVDCVGSQEFFRIRIGIGRPPENVPLADFVLSKIPQADFKILRGAVSRAADAAAEFIGGAAADALMQKWN